MKKFGSEKSSVVKNFGSEMHGSENLVGEKFGSEIHHTVYYYLGIVHDAVGGIWLVCGCIYCTGSMTGTSPITDPW